MRQVIPSCLLFLLLLTSAAGCLIHQYTLNQHRFKFRNYLSTLGDARLQRIIIHPSQLFTDSKELIWEDEGKEVVYRNVLCDVVRIETQGCHVSLLVVTDHEEEELKKQFSSHQGDSPSPFYLKLLKQLLTLEYLANDGLDILYFHTLADTLTHCRFPVPQVFLLPIKMPPEHIA